MSNKASLETLARTLSVALIVSFAVVAVSNLQPQEQTKALAVDDTAYLVVSPEPKPKREVKSNRTRALASQTPAPKDITERGIWLKRVLYEAGFRGKALETAWAVVMKESTGRPTAHNDNAATGDNSYGLFQINMIGSLGVDRRAKFDLKSNSDLFDPLVNAKAAYYMTNGGENWSAWDIDSSGYNGGVSESRYREWLKKYPKGKTWN